MSLEHKQHVDWKLSNNTGFFAACNFEVKKQCKA